MVNKIPIGASIVMLFGEIDCREGILVAVEKGESIIESSVDVVYCVMLNTVLYYMLL